MAKHSITPADRQRAQDRVEVFARSMFLLQGLPTPGADAMGNLISQAIGGISPDELRHPDSLSQATIGRIGQLVSNSSEAGQPRNIHGAEAARMHLAAGTTGVAGFMGISRFAALGGAAGDSDAGSDRSGAETSSSRRFSAIRAQDDRAREVAASPTGMTGSPASTFINQFGVDRSTAAMFQNYGMTGAAYGGLLNQGFGAGQIRQAAEFAGELGVKAGAHAKNVIKLDEEERAAVRKAVDEARAQPDLSAEQRKALVERLEQQHPGIKKKMGGAKAAEDLIGDAMKANIQQARKKGLEKARSNDDTNWNPPRDKQADRGADKVVARAASLEAVRKDVRRSAALGDDDAPDSKAAAVAAPSTREVASTPTADGLAKAAPPHPKKPEAVRAAAKPGGPILS